MTATSLSSLLAGIRCLSLIFLCLSPLAKAGYVEPSIWPEPQQFLKGEKRLSFSSNVLKFVTYYGEPSDNSGGVSVDTLNQAYDRYNKIIFGESFFNSSVSQPSLAGVVNVFVKDIAEPYPQLETDESYTLSIPETDGGSIEITSKTVYGALRALESLSQLVIYDYDVAAFYVGCAPVSVRDAPRYAHRGILLDTARHYEPITAIERLLDSMSYAKFNVFHWHVVDTQSFPFQSLSYPKLWDGAFTRQERYRQEDVKHIVEYARLRGIKTMIEFDMPGHAGSWCVGYPEVCPSAKCTQPLDPSNEQTFTLIDGLLAESTGREEGKGLFPYSLLHLGGDEVSYSCWETSPHIQKWKMEQGMSDSEDIYEYFVDKVASITRTQKRTPVQWVEVFEHFGSNLDNNTIIHIWKEKSTLNTVVSAGYRAILSDYDLWYLDHLEVTWEMMYENEPTSVLSNQADAPLVIGGQACMWGETVDYSDLENTVWPRAAAVAERLWTPESLMDVGRALDRIQSFRCLLESRGISAAPVLNKRARQAPREPGSCYQQRRRA